jgi:hypothetical protein
MDGRREESGIFGRERGYLPSAKDMGCLGGFGGSGDVD